METCGVNFPLVSRVGGVVFVLLCLKTQSSVPPVLLQSFPLLLPQMHGVGQNRTGTGGMVVLGILLSSSTLPFSGRLGTWGPSDYRALERDIPCHAGACEIRRGQAASGHLQVPMSTITYLEQVCHLEKRSACFTVLKAVLRSSACRAKL